MTYTQQQLDEELGKLMAPKLKMPKMYSFDQVQQILLYSRKELVADLGYKEPEETSLMKNEKGKIIGVDGYTFKEMRPLFRILDKLSIKDFIRACDLIDDLIDKAKNEK
jgi:hypothetical protein